MKILVTGGAGYIGSFMVKRLLDDSNEVVIADDLERGHQEVLDQRATFLQGNLLDKDFVKSIFSTHTFDGIVHFAGYISMGESMKEPGMYFENNVYGALHILEELKRIGSGNFIFSSTAGVYGNPIHIPISEDHPKNPENPYGESKLMVEKILGWYQKTHNINYTALRYFNAAGGSLDGKMGEDHDPETHIIPNAIHSVLENSQFSLFGNDYDTTDGTCVRDYIHVLDLVEAHVLALKQLKEKGGGYAYNVGTGKGYSNKEVIQMVNEVAGKEVNVEILPRRAGDADTLIADPRKIKNELGFQPQHSDLKTIVDTAWKWHQNNAK